MKKYIFTLLFITFQILFSQSKINSINNYESFWVRPSISILKIEYFESKTVLPEREGKVKIVNYDIPNNLLNDDFDLFKLKLNYISENDKSLYNSPAFVKTENLNEFTISVSDYFLDDFDKIVPQITGKFISSIFYLENGKVNYDKIQERALKSMSEESRNRYINSLRGIETSARDYLTQKVLDMNYLIILQQSYNKIFWRLYKVQIGLGNNKEERINNWYNRFNESFGLMEVSNFPVKLIDKGSFNGDYQTLINYNHHVLKKLLKKIRDKIPRLRMRSRILDDLTISIGDKEKVKIDDKFVSYIEVENEKGEIVELKKKGIDRVKSVGVNSKINIVKTSEPSERTKLYPDGGSNSSKGMISIKKKEVGVGLNYIYLDKNKYGYRVDYRTKWLPNFFIYFEGISWGGSPYNFGSEDGSTGGTVSFGIQKTFSVFRNLNFSTFLSMGSVEGYDSNINFDEISSNIVTTNQQDTPLIEFGGSIGFKLFSFQIIPTFRYILTTPEGFFNKKFQLGSSFRINF